MTDSPRTLPSRREELRAAHHEAAGEGEPREEWLTFGFYGIAAFIFGCCLLLPFVLVAGVTWGSAVFLGAPLWLVLVLGAVFFGAATALVLTRWRGSLT